MQVKAALVPSTAIGAASDGGVLDELVGYIAGMFIGEEGSYDLRRSLLRFDT